MELNFKLHGSNRRKSLAVTSDLHVLNNQQQKHGDHYKGWGSRRFSDSEFIENVHLFNQSALNDRSPTLTKCLPKLVKESEGNYHHSANDSEKKSVHVGDNNKHEQKLSVRKIYVKMPYLGDAINEPNNKSPKLGKDDMKSPLLSDVDFLARIDESENEASDDKTDEAPGYVISTFPPVGIDEIDKHKQMNKEAEENSKSRPHVYEEYLRKLYVQKKLLEKRKREEEQRMLRRRNRRLQMLKLKLKEAKEEAENEVDTRPESSKKETVKRKKIIQSFRYSRAIEEYYKTQLGADIIFLDEDNLDNLGGDEIVNGWLVKSVGPQVLNLRARTLPSCNPILLRLRQQEANQRSFQRSRLYKKYSNLSSNSSQKLSRSHDSLTSLIREPIGLGISDLGDISPRNLAKVVNGQVMSNIPELKQKSKKANSEEKVKRGKKSQSKSIKNKRSVQ